MAQADQKQSPRLPFSSPISQEIPSPPHSDGPSIITAVSIGGEEQRDDDDEKSGRHASAANSHKESVSQYLDSLPFLPGSILRNSAERTVHLVTNYPPPQSPEGKCFVDLDDLKALSRERENERSMDGEPSFQQDDHRHTVSHQWSTSLSPSDREIPIALVADDEDDIRWNHDSHIGRRCAASSVYSQPSPPLAKSPPPPPARILQSNNAVEPPAGGEFAPTASCCESSSPDSITCFEDTPRLLSNDSYVNRHLSRGWWSYLLSPLYAAPCVGETEEVGSTADQSLISRGWNENAFLNTTSRSLIHRCEDASPASKLAMQPGGQVVQCGNYPHAEWVDIENVDSVAGGTDGKKAVHDPFSHHHQQQQGSTSFPRSPCGHYSPISISPAAFGQTMATKEVGPIPLPDMPTEAPSSTKQTHCIVIPIAPAYDEYPRPEKQVTSDNGRSQKPKKKILQFLRWCVGKIVKQCTSGYSEGQDRRQWYYLAAVILVVVVVTLTTIIGVALSDRPSVQNGWADLSGYPPMPTGTFLIAGVDARVQTSGCINPSSLWSCALPKEQQAANRPYLANQPAFKLQIRVQGNSSMRIPSPSPPSDEDQTFIGNTTEHNEEPFAGERAPFGITFLSPAGESGGLSGSNYYQRRQFDEEGGLFPNLTTLIPPPDISLDGTAAEAMLYPLPSSQPIHLYNRGQPDEHYGFYVYFDRSIFLETTSPLNGSITDPLVDDADGGSSMESARIRCTWSQTRFLFQIWTTNKGQKNLNGNAASHFPYPVTISLDRHGGEYKKKLVYCYGIDEKHQFELSQRKIQVEDRGYGGLLVNPAPGIFNISSSPSHAGDPWSDGGTDGGTGGCACQWVNWF